MIWGRASIPAYDDDRMKATGVARRNNLFSSSNVIMAGSRRVQTAERVHYYFSRKCMVWTNGWNEGLYREKERERGR